VDRHGRVEFCWQEDLFVVKTYGPFNEEGVDYCITELKNSVVAQDLKRWQRMEIFCEETLASPEAMKEVKESYHWHESHGCYAVAVVVKNNLQKQVVESMVNSPITQVFFGIEDAKSWLIEKRC